MSLDLREAWRDHAAGEFARCAQAGGGFSFSYDGKSFGPEFGSEWRLSTSRDAESSSVSIAHGTGLVVTRDVRTWAKFNAIEYRLHFKNTSSTTLARLADIQSLDLSFAGRVL